MFDLDKWQEILSTIKKHKLRTALTSFGVAWGILMLVLMLGAGTGFRNGVEKDFDVARNAVFMWTRQTSMPYKGLQPGRRIRFQTEDVRAIRENVSEVEVLCPNNNLRGDFTVNYGTKSASFEVQGVYPDITKIRAMSIVTGRFLNHFDIEKSRKVAIIGEVVRENLFGKEINPIGKYIKVKGVYFRVVGMHRSKGNGEEIREEGQKIYIPQTAMQRAFNQIGQIHWFAFTPKAGIPSKVIETKIKQVLAKRHKVHPEDLKAFGSANVEEQYQKVQGLFTGIGAISWFVSIGTIFAGMVGVSNIMLIIVKERTKEIGVRKALGATPFSIVSLIVQESIVITAFAGYIGLLAGVGIWSLINGLLGDEGVPMFVNPSIDVNTVTTAIVLLIITGALAGLFPASKAARVKPVVALKDE